MQSMAASAREKFQSSARELMKNFEEAVMNTSSNSGNGNNNDNSNTSTLENAIRTMFSSCTSPSSGNGGGGRRDRGGDDDDTYDDDDRDGSYYDDAAILGEPSLSSSSSTSISSRRRNRHQKRRSTSHREAGQHNNKSGNRASAKSSPKSSTSSPSANKRNSRASNLAPSAAAAGAPDNNNGKEIGGGEHIYAQLFFDDQIRAARAVKKSAGFSNAPQEAAANQPQQPQNLGVRPDVPKPFPASSPTAMRVLQVVPMVPQQHQQQVVPPPPPPAALPLSTQELDISANLTFDDSISAISAHTLEAMAQTNNSNTPTSVTMVEKVQHQRQLESGHYSDISNKASRESLLVVNNTPNESQLEEEQQLLGAAKSPFALPRTRSAQTANTSKNSGSTRTTESSSFENWHREEKKYWANVEHQERHEHAISKKKGGRKSKWSSSGSGIGGAHRHPHDTFQHRFENNVFSYNAEEEPVAYVDTSRFVRTQQRPADVSEI